MSERLDIKALCGCLIVSFLFGILHAYSLFVVPLETAFDAGRSGVSFTYSAAVLSLSIAVLLGHRVYGVLQPWAFCALTFGLGAIGLVLSATASQLWQVWLFYGVVFGAANGLGYGFALQFSAKLWPTKTGWAMGLVTAAYAAGAATSPPVLAYLLGSFGWSGTLITQAVLYLVAAPVVASLMMNCETRFEAVVERSDVVRWSSHIGRWAAYGLAVFAGLMLLSQSSEVLREGGGSGALATAGPTRSRAGPMWQAVFGGWATDRVLPRRPLCALPIGSAAALLAMVLVPSVTIQVVGVMLAGFFYGATIAAYPAVLSKRYPGAKGISVYGVVFTAWGIAGVAAPFTAGALFDAFGAYQIALMVGAALAVCSAVLALRLDKTCAD